MGTTCCGYALGQNKPSVSAPFEVNELQTNINHCLDGTLQPNALKKDINIHENSSNNSNIYNKNSIEKSDQKEKYEAFEPNPEGLESSNLPSQDNNMNQLNNAQKQPVTKGKSKEFDETLPESTNLKLKIDLSAIPLMGDLKERGQKSPKKTTNIHVKKERKIGQKDINIFEMKLSDETTKKLTLIKEKSEKNLKKSPQQQAYLKSATINSNIHGDMLNGNESEFYELSIKTKKLEEIKLEFIEDKRKLDKKQSEKSLHKKSPSRGNNANIMNSSNNKSSIQEKSSKDVPLDEKIVNWNHEELKRLASLSPKKSLLKRAKTIGEELKGDKNKKKVKFKDLDLKGRKRKK